MAASSGQPRRWLEPTSDTLAPNVAVAPLRLRRYCTRFQKKKVTIGLLVIHAEFVGATVVGLLRVVRTHASVDPFGDTPFPCALALLPWRARPVQLALMFHHGTPALRGLTTPGTTELAK